ncbi:MAG TPA: glutamate synthase subunit beta [Longimicrobiales bacterium]
MGDPTGFMRLHRIEPRRRPVEERLQDWKELYEHTPDEALATQATRCMDCGVPFCQGDTGCPVHNVIPDWNDLVRRDLWREAAAALHATNNFPEVTGRLCPAPCESACVLGLVDRPVTIRHIEERIAERAFDEGWTAPQPPLLETGYTVAVVGSGPAGLAAAQQLRRLGHGVVVFEEAPRPGGLLRYGIPEFKMEKWVLDRRLAQMEAEGVVFRTGVRIGRDLPATALRDDFDAVLLAIGARTPRDLQVPGRDLRGIHFAMEYLTQQNRALEGFEVPEDQRISAAGKRVVVLGGGDTGSDCVGTALRQGALEVVQFELLPRPPEERDPSTPWPLYPMQLRSSHAHEEGGRREWSVSTTAFSGAQGQVERLHAVRVARELDADGRARFVELPETIDVDASLVILALGFTGPERGGLLDELGVQLDLQGRVAVDALRRTSADSVFAAGDAKRGASLIVWAIREGRDTAAAVDAWLRARASA